MDSSRTNGTNWVLPATSSDDNDDAAIFILEETINYKSGDNYDDGGDNYDEEEDEELGYQSFPFSPKDGGAEEPPEFLQDGYSAVTSMLLGAASAAGKCKRNYLTRGPSLLHMRVLSKLQKVQESWWSGKVGRRSQLMTSLADEAAASVSTSAAANNSKFPVPQRNTRTTNMCGRSFLSNNRTNKQVSGNHGKNQVLTTGKSLEDLEDGTILVELAPLSSISSSSPTHYEEFHDGPLFPHDVEEEEGYECVVSKPDYMVCAEMKQDARAVLTGTERKQPNEHSENIFRPLLLKRV